MTRKFKLVFNTLRKQIGGKPRRCRIFSDFLCIRPRKELFWLKPDEAGAADRGEVRSPIRLHTAAMKAAEKTIFKVAICAENDYNRYSGAADQTVRTHEGNGGYILK